MTDRTNVVPAPGVMSQVRRAMRRSPSHRLDDQTPDRIADLLTELDRSVDRTAR